MGARLDQHFLTSPEARDAIIAAAALSPEDSVVEIGPGKGMLTRPLLSRVRAVTAVELDGGLAARLPELPGAERLRVLNADFLKLDWEALPPGPFKIVANLPYAVGTPILQKILPRPGWTLAVLMFQKEVAERIAAAPGSADYGLLTLSVLLHAEPELLFEVGRASFSPPPRVDSAVVRLVRRPRPLLAGPDEEAFFKLARAAFGQRRKMAAGLLAQACGAPRSRVVEALARLGVGATARAAEIPLEAYLRLPSELGAA